MLMGRLEFIIYGNLITCRFFERKKNLSWKSLLFTRKTKKKSRCGIYQRSHYFPVTLPLAILSFLRTMKIKKNRKERGT